MPTLTNRSDFATALKSASTDTAQLFQRMSSELATLVIRYADSTGKVPAHKSQALRDEARAIVQKYFYTVQPVTNDAQERAHITRLINEARKQLKGATTRQQNELYTRLNMLLKRMQLLERGQQIVTIDEQGRGNAAFGKAILEPMRTLIQRVIEKQGIIIRDYLA